MSNCSQSGAQDVIQHKISNCSQSGADLFADSRDGSVRRDSLRSVRITTATRDEEREEEIDGGSRVMPNMPGGHLGPERGQGRSTEESRKLSPTSLRHHPQILGNKKEEEEEEEEEEDLQEERQHIEHSVEARVVVQLDRSQRNS